MVSAKYLIFDLDGTLVDPKLGITKSIQYALEKMGVQSPPADTLEWCIGPPMHLSMRKLLSSTDEDIVEHAVSFFAERFGTIGKYEGVVYPGAVVALDGIKRLGHKTYLATSKPQMIAVDILKHFALDGYFDGVYGSVGDKTPLLASLLETEALNAADTLMIGDREHDIVAAKKNAIRSVGVTYGYGPRDKLITAGPDYLFDSLVDFANSLSKPP